MEDLRGLFTLDEVCVVYQLISLISGRQVGMSRDMVWEILRARVSKELELHPDGRTRMARTWKDNKKHGVEQYCNGERIGKLTWNNGKITGLEQWWYDSERKLVERTWKDGKQDGVEQWWYYNGQTSIKRLWKNGKLYMC